MPSQHTATRACRSGYSTRSTAHDDEAATSAPEAEAGPLKAFL